jgi:hypothetical protein
MSTSTSKSSTLSKKAPSFDPEHFTFWSTLCQAHVGKTDWALFEDPVPELDDDAYRATFDVDDNETAESRAILKAFHREYAKYEKNQNKVHQLLVEACSETKALRLMTIEYIKLPGIEFYRSLEKRYHHDILTLLLRNSLSMLAS